MLQHNLLRHLWIIQKKKNELGHLEAQVFCRNAIYIKS